MPYHLSRGIFRCAQYDVKSPIGTSCHFPSAGTPPFRRACARHLPRFIGGVYPEGGSKKYVILSVSEISHRTIDLLNELSLRGKRSDEAISREGEFLCHRVNEKTKCVIATLALAKIRKFRL